MLEAVNAAGCVALKKRSVKEGSEWVFVDLSGEAVSGEAGSVAVERRSAVCGRSLQLERPVAAGACVLREEAVAAVVRRLVKNEEAWKRRRSNQSDRWASACLPLGNQPLTAAAEEEEDHDITIISGGRPSLLLLLVLLLLLLLLI
jgi:hypothetical protein